MKEKNTSLCRDAHLYSGCSGPQGPCWRVLDSGSAKRAWWKCHFIRDSLCKALKCLSPFFAGRTSQKRRFSNPPAAQSTIWTSTHFKLIKASKLCNWKRRFVTRHISPQQKSWIVFTSRVYCCSRPGNESSAPSNSKFGFSLLCRLRV